MIKKIIRLINSIVFNNIKLIFIKLLNFRRFHFNLINYISPLVSIDIQDKGTLTIGKYCNIYSHVKLGVRSNGKLIIQKGTFINNNCQFIAHKSIKIGENVSFGPNVMIYDHDHIFNKHGIIKGKYNSDDVTIGNNVWIGANCVILKGSSIGDNCVIAAGSIVKGKIPKNTIFVQKRVATLIRNGDINE